MHSAPDSVVLPRGGVLFPSSAGWIQFGAVPETIKDTMVLPDGVPNIYVVPRRLFSAERGISLAELEFPAYYHFFIWHGRIRIVCRPEQRPILETVFREALFGPSSLDPLEFAGSARRSLPDLSGELAFFRRHPLKANLPMQLDDLVQFIEFDEQGAARINSSVTIGLEEDGGISIHDRGAPAWRWHGDPPLPAPKAADDGPLKAFRGPQLGVSVIGSGHGFDPGNRTSGFIVWIGGTGVLVDPPVDWVDWLSGYDINPKQLDTLILTHCHADHDAGTLQKIMQEGRVTIYATPTVLSSFINKYSALTSTSPEAFRDLFDYVPVQTGEPLYLHGAEAVFHYSLHSIPCAGFEIRLRDRSLVYPSDTLNEPASIHRLHESGILSRSRRDDLLAFPWHHDLVLHEAGIPPIHTPIEYLATLQEEIKKRTLLVHTSAKTIPPGSGLQVAATGLENTHDLAPRPNELQEGLRVLEAMARVAIFSELPVSRGCEFLQMARKAFFTKGQKILHAGARGDVFHIILSGLAGVWMDGRELKTYRAYDYIGETSILLEQPRTADVIAKTDVETLVLDHHQFLYLIRDTDIGERLARLARRREQASWALLESSPIFSSLTSNQKNQLEALMEATALDEGAVLDLDPILIATGTMRVSLDTRPLVHLEPGALACDVARLIHGLPSLYAFQAETTVQGFILDHRELRKFLRENPGAYLKLADAASGWPAGREPAASAPTPTPPEAP